MAGSAEELDAVDEWDGIKRVFRYNMSLIDPPLGELGEIFPSGNIWPNTPRSGSINDKYTIANAVI